MMYHKSIISLHYFHYNLKIVWISDKKLIFNFFCEGPWFVDMVCSKDDKGNGIHDDDAKHDVV